MFEKVKQNIKNLQHKEIWFISLDGMATGFFAGLIAAFFVGLLGRIPGLGVFDDMKVMLTYTTPLFIGITIGIKGKGSLFQILGLGIIAMIIGHSTFHPSMDGMKLNYIAGFENIGEFGFKMVTFNGDDVAVLHGVGDAFSAWLGATMLLYVFRIFKWESTFDFIIIPALAMFLGMFGATFITFITQTIAGTLGYVLGQVQSKEWLMIVMSPVIAVLMGITLSLPISSAALAIMIGMSGTVAAVSIAGTTAQMFGFAIITYFGNKDLSETTAVGFGTSMFQMKNFVKKPKLFILPSILSAITGLLTAFIFKDMFPVETSAAGMGWAAMYGPILTLIENLGVAGVPVWQPIIHVLVIQTILPIVMGIPLAMVFFKKGWLKPSELHIWAPKPLGNDFYTSGGSVFAKTSGKIK